MGLGLAEKPMALTGVGAGYITPNARERGGVGI